MEKILFSMKKNSFLRYVFDERNQTNVGHTHNGKEEKKIQGQINDPTWWENKSQTNEI